MMNRRLSNAELWLLINVLPSLTNVDKQLLRAVLSRGKVKSLLSLVDELGINYSNAYRSINKLANHGLLVVERRGTGCSLVITCCSDDESPLLH